MKYQVGSLILKVKDEDRYYSLPGSKPLKKGLYKIVGFRKSVSSPNDMIFNIKLNRKNASHTWNLFQEFVEDERNFKLWKQ